jgi:hypothetical protein
MSYGEWFRTLRLDQKGQWRPALATICAAVAASVLAAAGLTVTVAGGPL